LRFAHAHEERPSAWNFAQGHCVARIDNGGILAAAGVPKGSLPPPNAALLHLMAEEMTGLKSAAEYLNLTYFAVAVYETFSKILRLYL
jgi:hypothetical protein